jgi:glycine hydroxymethyltransferase
MTASPAARPKEPVPRLLQTLGEHQLRASRSLNFIPSENVLSPLARLPFVLDVYSRYYFEHFRLFGAWMFYGAIEPGAVENDVLIPLLREMSGASYINVRPISGMNCLTVMMAALCEPGDIMYTVPVDFGGHMSTPIIGRRLGIDLRHLPMSDPHTVDLDRLRDLLMKEAPAAIYIDQSTELFPIDPRPIRQLLDEVSPRTLLHYDSSHINGLILGRALFNPLERGADSFGGSTHKTLPGPHKGFVATNNAALAERVTLMADHFVSHHHFSDVLSLTITLLEMRDCGGAEYAQRILTNSRRFAEELDRRGVEVAAADRGFTGCHQVWVVPRPSDDAQRMADQMYEAGLVVNRLGSLPGIDRSAFRLSMAEVTRLGATESEITELADIFAGVLLSGEVGDDVHVRVGDLRSVLDMPRYCYSPEQIRLMAPAPLASLVDGITECLRSSPHHARL